jgi:hypothetical protein
MFVWEIRERLVRDGVCKPTSLPSLSTLTRMLRDNDQNGLDDQSPMNIIEQNEDFKDVKGNLNLLFIYIYENK